jgi:hypothetical protein
MRPPCTANVAILSAGMRIAVSGFGLSLCGGRSFPRLSDPFLIKDGLNVGAIQPNLAECPGSVNNRAELKIYSKNKPKLAIGE